MSSTEPAAADGAPANAFREAIVRQSGASFLPAVSQMLEWQVCPRCCLRVAGCSQPGDFCGPAPLSEDLHRHCVSQHACAETEGQPRELPESSCGVCTVCLGALQQGEECTDAAATPVASEPTQPGQPLENLEGGPHPEGGTWLRLEGGPGKSLAALVAAAVEQEGHDFSSFSFEVMVPAASVARERALAQALQESAVCKQPLPKALPLADALRMHILGALETHRGAVYSPGAGMTITLALHHAETLAEAAKIAPPRPTTAGNGSRKRKFGKEAGGPGPTNATHAALITSCISNTVQARLQALSATEIKDICDTPPAPRSRQLAAPYLRCARRPDGGAGGAAMYLGGRYRKLKRGISQSPWLIDGAQKGTGSVQEAVQDLVMPHVRADSCKFQTAGREDIDVRMLGQGRPFIMEFFNPRRVVADTAFWQGQADQLASAGKGVEIIGLQAVGRDTSCVMKEGEAEKEKTYCAVVWLSRNLTAEDIAALTRDEVLTLRQGTPLRVLHRRAAMTRERHILKMECELLEGCQNYAKLHLKASAGTYIKEFVTGDFGRTRPSISSLLSCRAQIIQLDVMNVHLDFL